MMAPKEMVLYFTTAWVEASGTCWLLQFDFEESRIGWHRHKRLGKSRSVQKTSYADHRRNSIRS